MKVITGKTKAWLTAYGDPEALTEGGEKAISEVAFSNSNMSSQGWTYVGEATITFECVDNDTLILNKVAALRGELQSVRAKAEIETGNIEAKIQKLLAITNEVMV